MAKHESSTVAQGESQGQLHLRVRVDLEIGSITSKTPQCLMYGYSISPHSTQWTNAEVLKPLKTTLSISFPLAKSASQYLYFRLSN
jgi:hypothetical protein